MCIDKTIVESAMADYRTDKPTFRLDTDPPSASPVSFVEITDGERRRATKAEAQHIETALRLHLLKRGIITCAK